MKKYELTSEYVEFDGRKLYRIKALKSFYLCGLTVKAGALGGYIEKEENLSHEGTCWVYDNARVCENARVCGDARVCDNAYVCDNACVYGNARVCGDAKINKISDVLCISPIGSRNDTTTFFKTKDGNICVKCGCFTDTIDKFLEAVSETHKDNKHAKAYKLACELARVQIELEDVRNGRILFRVKR